MMKKILLSLLLVLLAGGAVVFFMYPEDTSERPDARSIDHFRPAKTPFLIEASGLNYTGESLGKLGIVREVRESQFYSLYQNRLKPMLDTYQNSSYRTLKKGLGIIRSYTGNRGLWYGTSDPISLVAIQNLSTPKSNSDNPYVEFDQYLSDLLNRIKTNDAISIEKSSHRGVTIRSLRLTADFDDVEADTALKRAKELMDRFAPSIARLHNHLIVGSDRGAVRDALDRYATTTSAPSDNRLADNDKLSIRYRTDGQYIASLYRSLADRVPDEFNRRNQLSLNAQIIDGYGSIEGTFDVKDAYLHHKNELQWKPKSMIDGLRKSLKVKPKDLDLPHYFPSKALWALATRTDLSESRLNWYVDNGIKPRFFNDTNSDTGPHILEETLPMDGIRQFAGSLRSEAGASISLNNAYFNQLENNGEFPTGVLPVDALAVFEVKNQARLNRALETIAENPFIKYNALQQEITIDFVVREQPLYLKKHEKRLLVSLREGQLDRAISRFDNSGGLPRSGNYRALREQLPETTNQITFLSLAPFSQPLQRNWLSLLEDRRRQQVLTMVGFNPLNELGKILGNTEGTMSAVTNNPKRNRVVFEMYSSGDLAVPTLGFAAGAASAPILAEQWGDVDLDQLD